MFAIKTFMTYVLNFLILWLRLQSLSRPNNWLRPKMIIAPTVQHCKMGETIQIVELLKSQKIVSCFPIKIWSIIDFTTKLLSMYQRPHTF